MVDFDDDVHAAKVAVVPVLHGAGGAVPGGAVGDALGKVGAVVHGQVVLGVAQAEVFEEFVVGGGGVLAGGDAVVVVGVVDDDFAGVEVGGEDEAVFHTPLHGGLGFGFASFEGGCAVVVVVEGEVVGVGGEVAVEVAPVGVVASVEFESVGVEQGEDGDFGFVDEAGDVGVGGVVVEEQVDEVDAEFGADGFVAVHGGDVAELGFVFLQVGVVADE